MKDQLGGRIMTNFVELRAQMFNQLIDNGSGDRKSKRYKKVCRKKVNLNLNITKTVWKELSLIIK